MVKCDVVACGQTVKVLQWLLFKYGDKNSPNKNRWDRRYLKNYISTGTIDNFKFLNCVSDSCKKSLSSIISGDLSEYFSDISKFLQCNICGHVSYDCLSIHLRKCHNVNIYQYLELCPGSKYASDKYSRSQSLYMKSLHDDPEDKLHNAVRRTCQDPDYRRNHSLRHKEIHNRENVRRSHSIAARECQNRPSMLEYKSKQAISQLQSRGGHFRYKHSDTGRNVYCGVNGTIRMMSSWELDFAYWCDSANINWEYGKYVFKYLKSDGSVHRYLTDFFLPDLKMFVELHPLYLMNEIMFAKIESVPYEFDSFVIDGTNWLDIYTEIKWRNEILKGCVQ